RLGEPHQSSTAAPECDLTVAKLARLTTTVDSAPQAYFRLERAVVEDGQHFGNVRTAAPPQTVPGVGLDADWFPDHTELLTTDGARLISVTVHWPGATQARARALAEALARTYLGQAHG
ncbi:MAG: hypothetical protein ACXVQR_06810, partial [Solirubrobacteraceae bacterium]